MIGILRQVQGWIKVKDATLSRFLKLISDSNSRNAAAVKETWTSNTHDYQSDNVLKNLGTSNHDYTVGADSYLTEVAVSSSGELIAYDVLVNGTQVYTFYTSLYAPSNCFVFKSPIKVLSGQTIRITKTNLDNKDVDVETTIITEILDG